MLKSLFLYSAFLGSVISLSTSHPISLAMLLMMNCVFISVVVGKMTHSWLLYLLILVFLGGVMVAVTYMTSLAANEKLYSLSGFKGGLWGGLLFIYVVMDEQKVKSASASEFFPSMLFTGSFSPSMVFCFLVLLLTLVSVVKLLSVESGPLVKRLLISNLK